METVELIIALLRINEACDIVFKDKNNHTIKTIGWEDIANIKPTLYHEKVQVANLKSLSDTVRKQIRIKFLNMEK